MARERFVIDKMTTPRSCRIPESLSATLVNAGRGRSGSHPSPVPNSHCGRKSVEVHHRGVQCDMGHREPPYDRNKTLWAATRFSSPSDPSSWPPEPGYRCENLRPPPRIGECSAETSPLVRNLILTTDSKIGKGNISPPIVIDICPTCCYKESQFRVSSRKKSPLQIVTLFPPDGSRGRLARLQQFQISYERGRLEDFFQRCGQNK